MNRIRILIIEKNIYLRNYIKYKIDSNPNFLIIGEAARIEEVDDLLISLPPDLILIDLDMLDGNLVEEIQKFQNSPEPAKILALTSQTDPNFLQYLLQVGIDGLLSKDQPISILQEAILKISQGEKYCFVPGFVPPTSLS